jgi:hypothetical protein
MIESSVVAASETRYELRFPGLFNRVRGYASSIGQAVVGTELSAPVVSPVLDTSSRDHVTSTAHPWLAGAHADKDRYFLSQGGAVVNSVGVEPPGASGLAGTGVFFGFFASLLPR